MDLSVFSLKNATIRKTNYMNNTTKGAQPISYYVISTEDMPNFVSSLIEQYQATQQVTPIECNQGERDLMTAAEVCEYLHVTPQTLHNWDKMRYLVKKHIGRKVYYNREDVLALAASGK